jgi:TIR domain
MAGINRARAENRGLAKLNESIGQPCIFLSHISVDKAAVIEIANYITARGDIDVYLDINDQELQQAAIAGDAVRITGFIERGLSNSTHIMCLVSSDTVRSWWVPYELGFAKRSGKPLSTLRLKDTVELPAYLEISEIIRGTKSLNQYLTAVKRGLRKTDTAADLTESLIRSSASPHPLDAYLNWQH